ncbi:hypothetical protein PHLGIDRAFT_16085 [Phlebiopsis gigantea 11061_1 CR5-6]|uniref:Copper-fist domain-containing protein n=1 Tax=Phlebiopsis gigantea (strain 11061_1 CR5-6) TaxID=745531 RepID=A0A0C3PD30_PHLG1|nr:hypothetical protein PHLGIDRAFT_16085 [Phlebiopsis gigantea 11061_1 CR5-6]
MVLVGDKKYACETCIKGHRSSNCKHTDRPLYEIKKKGRPVTQCEHCRELRKTKQVHVKCMCETKEIEVEPAVGPSATTITLTKKGGKKVPASATFPSGLPDALGASAASKPLSESSDSEHEGHTCTCKSTGECNCATPRARTSRGKKGKIRAGSEEQSTIDHLRMAQPAALVVTANSGRNRPVLPRPPPSSHSRSSPPRTMASPMGGPHHRSQSHFSPYGRAYDYAHGAEVGAELAMQLPPLPSEHYPPQSSQAIPEVARNNADEFSTYMNSWLATVPSAVPPADIPPPVTCDCGPNCSCPGCVIHRGPSAVQQGFESCHNNSTCTSCMDCTMLSALDNNPAFDDWLRRLSASDFPSDDSGAFDPRAASAFFVPSSSQQQQDPNHMQQQFDPGMWQTYALWTNLQNQPAAPSPPEDGTSACCSGQCKCPPGMCACPSDCCGCCTGCACPTCSHEDRSMGTGKTITFATSGERAPCCGSRNAAPHYAPQAGPSTTGSSQNVVDSETHRPLDLRGVYTEWDASGSSPVPRVSLSRASSSSARSSSQQSHRSSSHGPVGSTPAFHNSDSNVRSCCSGMQNLNTSTPASHHSGSNSNSPIPPSYSPSSVGQYSGSPFDIEDGSPRIF